MTIKNLKKIFFISLFIAVFGLLIAPSTQAYDNWNQIEKNEANIGSSNDYGPAEYNEAGYLGPCVAGDSEDVQGFRIRGGQAIFQYGSNTCLYKYNEVNVPQQKLIADTSHGSNAAIAGDVSYFTVDGAHSVVYAYNLETEKLLWQKDLSVWSIDSVSHGVVVAEDKIFISVQEGATGGVYALDKANGDILWQTEILDAAGDDTQLIATPAYGESKLFVKYHDGGVHGMVALEADNGLLIWRTVEENCGAGDSNNNSPIYNSGAVYGNVCGINSYNASNGVKNWHHELAGDYDGIVWDGAYWNGKLYYTFESTAGQARYIFFNANNGSEAWDSGSLGPLEKGLELIVSDNGIVYLFINGTSLKALSATDGSLVFNSDLPANASGLLGVYNGLLYVEMQNIDVANPGKVLVIAGNSGLPPDETITVTSPTCSIDGGLNYSSCINAQFGGLITHVQTTCNTGTVSTKDVRFTLASPTSVIYNNVSFSNSAGSTFRLKYPGVIDKEGQWTLTATCVNELNQTNNAGAQWTVNPTGSPDPQKLTIYDGTIRVTNSDSLEIGKLVDDPFETEINIDWLSSGSIYVRPNTSEAGSFLQGIAATDRQRLHLSGGIDGKPTLEATGLGLNGSPWIGAGIAGRFAGAAFNSGGSGIYGEVISCGLLKNCYAGYFTNPIAGQAVTAVNNSADNPTLIARNTDSSNYDFTPEWSPSPFTSEVSVFAGPFGQGPVQNTVTSRLYAYIRTNPDNQARVFSVDDDGTMAEGNALDPSLDRCGQPGHDIGFISDGGDGAYVGWASNCPGIGREHFMARVDASGNTIWDTAVNSAYGVSQADSGQYMSLSANANNLLFAFYNGGKICGMKINKDDGARMWSTDLGCTVGSNTAKELASEPGTVLQGMTEDGQGGLVIIYTSGVSTLRARHILNNGTADWTVDVTGSTLNGAGLIYYNNAVYARAQFPNNDLWIFKLNVSDGSQPWAGGLNLGPGKSVNSSDINHQLLVSDDSELTAVWRRESDGRLLMNRINTADGSKKWASDLEIADDVGNIDYRIFKGAGDVVYASYCFETGPNVDECKIQAIDGQGNLLLAAGGADIQDSRSEAMSIGHHIDNSGLSCIDQAFYDSSLPQPVGAEMYCFATNAISADFTGEVQVTEDVIADQNVTEQCNWVSVADGSVCPAGQFLNGLRRNSSTRHPTFYRCCKL
ncbi:MAG: PQQ-binding-like beta-propeller repeat protein [bacterium]